MTIKMNLDLLSENFGIQITDKIKDNFTSFAVLFTEYNAHTNLISKNDEKFLYEKHIFDSLALTLFLKKYNIAENVKLMDIGTGGGFPTLPLAICYGGMSITAVDSTLKKINFLQLIKDKLNLENLAPICSRVEDLDTGYKNHFNIVVSRAVADLNVILEYSLPFIKAGGYFVAYKSKTSNEEIEKSSNALKILGGKFIEKIDYKLPLEEEFVRSLIVIKKEKNTPKLYPRANGLVKKNPL